MATLRRLMMLAAVTMLALTGCSAQGESPQPTDSQSNASQSTGAGACDLKKSTDLSTPDGWLNYLSDHRDDVSLVIDDGTNQKIEHLASKVRPAASSIKVVHLLAYARAVADGNVDAKEKVKVQEWERFYYPADGGAHVTALKRLKIDVTRKGPNVTMAKDPQTTVTLDDLVSAMIRESDNAAADYLRDRLGDKALEEAAQEAGMTDTKATSLLGTVMGAMHPDLADQKLETIAQRYLSDDAWAKKMRESNQPNYDAQTKYLSRQGPMVTAQDLTSFYRKIADDSLGKPGKIARKHLEWSGKTHSGADVGFKAGSLTGVLTGGFEIRQKDGTTSTAAILVQNMEQEDYLTAASKVQGWQQMVLDAAEDDEARKQLACVIDH